MRLGLNLGYWGAGRDVDLLPLARSADELGYAVCWAAEAYGSDAPTVLAWVAAQTRRVDIGSAAMQIPARSAAMTAMTAATLDALSGGRFRLGLGVSGPQVSEGWHGVRFDAPLERTREYVDVVRMALAREPVRYAGRHLRLPLPQGPEGPEAPDKALRLTVHPVRERIPVYLAAVGPRNLELAGEIADGWLGIFYSPEHAAVQRAHLLCGARRAGRVREEESIPGFDVVASVPVVVDEDVERAASQVRSYAALYLGGMGSRQRNFYNQQARRMGFEAEAATVQELFLAGRHRDAAAAVPFGLLDATSLLGPPARIRDRLAAFADSGVMTLSVSTFGSDLPDRERTLRVVAEAVDAAGLAE